MLIFYFFAIIVIFLGLLSLRGGFDFAAYVKKEKARQHPEYTPYVSIIAPCRGLEPRLEQNVGALFRQDYPDYEIIFVTDSVDDPALEVIQKLINGGAARKRVDARIVIAGPATDSGQKVHNLRFAVTMISPRSEVIVLVDSDAQPHDEWLRSLVNPLEDENISAATGYRWFVAAHEGLASHLRSVWNASIASAVGPRADKNFCWGGSTAIRRATFESLGVRDAWRGTVSDDFALTKVLQDSRLPIHFVPQCLVSSKGGCTFRELFEFTNRQLKITRTYAPHLWRPLLIGSALFNAVFFGGLLLVAVRAAMGLSVNWPLLFLALIFALGSAKALIRLKAVRSVLKNGDSGSVTELLAHLFLWPLASALFLWNALVAAFSRRIVWRGITYELKSASEAVIIRRKEGTIHEITRTSTK